MRVSEKQRYETTNNRVSEARHTNAEVLNTISSLRRINKISDDPTGTSKALRYRDMIEDKKTFVSNINFSKGFIEKSESAIAGISENLMRAKELAVGLANATYDAQSREAAGKELEQIMREVVSLGNSDYAGKFVFSGYRATTPPLSANGKFAGDDGAIFLQVDKQDYRQINLQARTMFEATQEERQAGQFDMIEVLNLLRDGLNNNDVENIRQAIPGLDFQLQKTSSFQASLGALHNGLEASEDKIETELVSLKDVLSKIEEVDVFSASSDFHRTNSVLQSTMMASNKLLQPSLLNFLQ